MTHSSAIILAQLPTPQGIDLERWIASAAIVGSIVLLYTRLTGKKPGSEYVQRRDCVGCRASLSAELSALRDRIDSRHLSLLEALDKVQASLLSEAERREANIHRRLAETEAGLARLDERTKLQ